MKPCWKFLIVVVAGLGLLLVEPGDAFAKRLGGGKSFGSRPSYSQPYKPSPDAGAMPRSAPSALQAPSQRNQALRDSFRSRGGLMGMLGGLALGGLLGAMLFGGGFEHINFLDIAVFGLVAYLCYRLFASRRGSAQWAPGRGSVAAARGAYDTGDRLDSGRVGSERPAAGFDTDVLFRGRVAAAGAISGATALPEGFDQSAFLRGAEQAYRHLQQAWDTRDLAELRALTTHRVFEELHSQLQHSAASDSTEILGLDAQLLGVERDQGRLVASVLFTARLREEPSPSPTTVREVWHFTRDEASVQPTWFLDGIQQLNEAA